MNLEAGTISRAQLRGYAPGVGHDGTTVLSRDAEVGTTTRYGRGPHEDSARKRKIERNAPEKQEHHGDRDRKEPDDCVEDFAGHIAADRLRPDALHQQTVRSDD